MQSLGEVDSSNVLASAEWQRAELENLFYGEWAYDSSKWEAFVETYERAGEYEMLRMVYAKAIERDLSESHLAKGLVKAFRAAGDYVGAIVTLETAVNGLKNRINLESYYVSDWLVYLAEAIVSHDDYDQIMVDCIHMTRNVWIWSRGAEVYAKMGKYDRAIAFFQADGDTIPGSYVLSMLYEKKGDRCEAIRLLREATTKYSSALLWARLAEVYRADGNYLAEEYAWKRNSELNNEGEDP